MKFRLTAIAAAAVCCMSCVTVDNKLGGSFTPVSQTYDIFQNDDIPLKDISCRTLDQLSGISQERITIGSIRDDEYGTTSRGSVVTLVPMFSKELEIGEKPQFKSFHFAAAKDTTSVPRENQRNILQNIRVYELSKPVKFDKTFDTNTPAPEHSSATITKGTPVFDGSDSLSFNFTKAFGEKFLTMTKDDLKSIDKYLERFPGIYIETDKPSSNGGRINIFNLQLGFNTSDYFVEGTFATLNYSAEFKGERKDTSIMFYLGAEKLFDIDSLLSNTTSGQYPQYCLNITGHQTSTVAAKDKIFIEGGGGLKPFISAKSLKKLVEDEIISKGGNPSEAVINKATIVFPYEAPEDYRELTVWPQYLAPSCRIQGDNYSYYMSLTDSSSSSEDAGDIHRSLDLYSPDITYHVQRLLRIDESNTGDKQTKMLNNGSYDLWFLIMAGETVTTTSETSDEMSEYYNYLAYQSYYSSMYGGYGGYGYGGYGSSYNNYYTYMMLAAYANSSNTTTSVSVKLDKDRYYKAALNGPESDGRKPRLELVYSLPAREK